MPSLLVFSKTTGYRHESIAAGVAAVSEIGAGLGLTVDATEDADMFDAVNLSRYAAMVFLSPSGTIFETDAQRAALESYVVSGGGFVGIHAASTAESDWPFYGELVGGRFKSHPPVQPATVIVEDGSHPSTAHLGSTWTLADEWYEFTDDPRPRVHVLLSVDESTYEGGAMGPDHPISWQHSAGAGRCFYTALGHPIEAYAEPTFRAHLAGGIRSVVSGRAG
jgi:type 1 glutamine amidotransferase